MSTTSQGGRRRTQGHDPATNRLAWEVPHEGYWSDLSQDGSYLLVARSASRLSPTSWRVELWRTRDAHRVGVFPEGLPVTKCFSPDGRFLALATTAGIDVRATRDGRLVYQYHPGPQKPAGANGKVDEPLTEARFTPSGNHLVLHTLSQVLVVRTADWSIAQTWTWAANERRSDGHAPSLLVTGNQWVVCQIATPDGYGDRDALLVFGRPGPIHLDSNLLAFDETKVVTRKGTTYEIDPFQVLPRPAGRRLPARLRDMAPDGRFLVLLGRTELENRHASAPYIWAGGLRGQQKSNVTDNGQFAPEHRQLFDLLADRSLSLDSQDLQDVPTDGLYWHTYGPCQVFLGCLEGNVPLLIPAAEAIPPAAALARWATVVAGGELDAMGTYVAWEEETWRARQHELRQDTSPATGFPFPGPVAVDPLHWVRLQLRNELSTEAQLPLLDRLLAAAPTVALLEERANLHRAGGRVAAALDDHARARQLRGFAVTAPEYNLLLSPKLSPEDLTRLEAIFDLQVKGPDWHLPQMILAARRGRYRETLAAIDRFEYKYHRLPVVTVGSFGFAQGTLPTQPLWIFHPLLKDGLSHGRLDVPTECLAALCHAKLGEADLARARLKRVTAFRNEELFARALQREAEQLLAAASKPKSK